jgi:predicted metal-dependent hydrolase
MAKNTVKILSDPQIGDVLFNRSVRSRSISIKVHPTKGVTVTFPYIVPYAAARAFYQMRRDWVLETIARQKEKYKDVHIPSADEIEALRRKAKAELPPRLSQLAVRYGFTYNRVTIKHNATNWGSCSARSNINLNLNIVRLPKALQDYVLLHELCHLRHQDHGHGFHLLLEHVLTDNILKLMESGDPAVPSSVEDAAYASELARKAATSRAKYPMDHVMTRAIKAFRLV